METSNKAESRKQAERRGHRAEWVAAMFLFAKGYRIVARRYKTRIGEIDIIARKGDLVAFVEVKARRDINSSLDAVTGTSQRRIRSAGDLWLARQPDYAKLTVRYDIVAVQPFKLPLHFQDAF